MKLSACVGSAMALPFIAAVAAKSNEKDLFVDTFEVVWETIRDTYYDPDFNGVDWEAVYEARLPAVKAADDTDTLRMILRDMLAELGQSHFGIISGSPEMVESGHARGAGVLGLEVVVEDGDVIVLEVGEDTPAGRAGIRPGFKVMQIGDKQIEALARDAALLPMPETLQAFTFNRYVQDMLTGRIGNSISVRLLGQPGATSREFEMTFAPDRRTMTGGFGNMPRLPMEFETRELRGGIHYIHFNIFTLELMESLKGAVREAAARDASGLIFDLRGNPGGVGYMAAGLAGLMIEEELNLGTMQMRSGHISFIAYPQAGAYLGPVAILIDGRSASTSEIFAAGLREGGRARLFGSGTAGAVLPSMFKELPNGDTLQCVIADFQTGEGVFLEGRGVFPDESVNLRRRSLLAGRDPILDAAVQWLRKQ